MSAQHGAPGPAPPPPNPEAHERTLLGWHAIAAPTPTDRQAALAAVRALAALDRPHAILRWITEAQPSQPDLTEVALRIASRNLPRNLPLGIAYCEAAARRGDVKEAAARWWDLRKRVPRKAAPHLGYIACMIAERRLNEAERAALSALRFVRTKPDLLAAHAEVAEARTDWAEAARRWAVLLAASPSHPEAERRRAAAEQRARQTTAAPDPGPDLPTIPPAAELSPEEMARIRKRLMGFESLGRNCELGLLQRKFEAEPLGLLRFSTTRPATLLTLLRTRFEGVGDPEQNEVKLVKNEYRLRHRPSGWRMHTRINGDAEADNVLRDQCRRTAFLRLKLIRDLQAGEKVFVYQMAELDDADIDLIYAAVQDYGPSLLMCVRLSTPDHPIGSVIWPQPRLMVAHIDRQGQEFTGAGWDISVDYWLHFCNLAQQRQAELAWHRTMEQAFPT